MYLHMGGLWVSISTRILQRRAWFTEGHSLFYSHSSRFNMEITSSTHWSRTSHCLIEKDSTSLSLSSQWAPSPSSEWGILVWGPFITQWTKCFSPHSRVPSPSVSPNTWRWDHAFLTKLPGSLKTSSWLPWSTWWHQVTVVTPMSKFLHTGNTYKKSSPPLPLI